MIGAAMVAALAFAPRPHDHVYKHRLVLDAPSEPGDLYLTVFDGDVTIASHEPGLVPLRFETRAYLTDGCRWLGMETLTPMDAHRYAYRYDEAIISCEPGATPARKTPRTGIVTALPYDGHSIRFMMWKP